MLMIQQAALLALVGTALSAPLAHYRHHRTFYEGPFGRWSTNFGYSPTPTSEAETTTTTIVVSGSGPGQFVDSGSKDDDTPNTFSGSGSGSGAPSYSGSGSGSDSDSGSGSTPSVGTGSETGYMAVVAKWRAAGGLPAITQSSKLEANARKTAADGNGRMKHQLNPGTMGQVLAPGSADKFEHVYVGGWLCEDTSLPGLNGICGSMTAGWDHSSGEKGHAQILTNPKYKNIGCANAGGIWACDFS